MEMSSLGVERENTAGQEQHLYLKSQFQLKSVFISEFYITQMIFRLGKFCDNKITVTTKESLWAHIRSLPKNASLRRLRLEEDDITIKTFHLST